MISQEAQREGHRYVRGVNAHCPKCSEIGSREAGRMVTVLDCDYDDEF